MDTNSSAKLNSRLTSAAVLLVLRVVGIATLILTYKSVAWRYDGDTLGQYTLALVLMQMASQLVCFGIPVYLMKTISAGEGEPQRQVSFYGRACSAVSVNLVLLLGGIASVAGLAWFLSFESFISLPLYSLGYVALSAIFNSFRLLNSQAIRGMGRTKLFQIYDCLVTPVLFLLLFHSLAVVAPGFEYRLHVVLGAHATAVASCCLLSFCTTHQIGLGFLWRFSFGGFFELLAGSKDFFVIQAITLGFGWSSILLLATFASPSAAGAMNIILKSVSLLGIVISVVNSYAGPVYSRLFEQKQVSLLRDEVQRNTRIILASSVPFIVVMFVYCRQVLMYFDPGYQELTLAFMVVLAGATVNVCFGSVGLLMQMCQLQKPFRKIIFNALLIHIAIGFTLSPFLGAVGIAIGYSLSLTFWNVVSAVKLKMETGVPSYFEWS